MKWTVPGVGLGRARFYPLNRSAQVIYYTTTTSSSTRKSKKKKKKKNRVSWRVEKLSTNSARRVGTP